jgi:phosphoesterase RecJ-like protein
MYGLGLQLEKLGKQVSYFSPDAPDRSFDFLDLSTLQTEFDYGTYDLLAFTDFTEYKRIEDFTSDFESYFDEKQKVVIDHHLFSGELPNASIWKDETANATCELIYELTTQRREGLIDEEIATFLYMGMLTDSGNLLYDEKDQTERLMSDMLGVFRLGAKKKLIVDNVLRRKSYADVQFMQFILGRMQKEGDLLYSRYTQAEKLQFQAEYATPDSDHALHVMQDIEGFDVVIIGKENDKGIGISIRGRGKYDCNIIAQHFGGGGHFNAAGCTLPPTDNVESAMKDFITEVKKLI